MFGQGDDSRRDFLKCMAWAGTGALFAFNGGIGSSIGLDSALAEPLRRTAVRPFTFVQLSDSHIGFNKPPNADARATFREAVAKVKALAVQPDFIIHTGDVSQLSRDDEFDDADQILKEAGLPVFFIPGEHDMLDPDGGKAFLNRFGKGSKGAGWYSFDHRGVHFVALVNVADLSLEEWAISAPSSSSGWRRTSPGGRRQRQSSCSLTSRCGPCTRNGAGARTIPLRR